MKKALSRIVSLLLVLCLVTALVPAVFATMSFDGSSTPTRTFFTSVVMAKPKRIICTTGIPNKINIVRRSRNMWKNSFFTNAINCFIY